jgi:phosphatidate cytidylyltransferase
MSPEPRREAHLKRWVTGLALLPVLIVCVLLGGWVFSLLVGAAVVICLWEFFRIVYPAGTGGRVDPFRLAGYLAGILVVAAAHAGRPELIVGVLAANVLAGGLISIGRFAGERRSPEWAAREVQGVCYIPLLLSFFIMLRALPDGIAWIFVVCAVVFAGDIGALYAGTLWGRHKLSPAISPGKSVEGALAGLAANLLTASAAKALFLPELGWGACWLFALAIGLAGQAGDLFESGLKRVSNVKDSGGLLPGHGGILDRIDALLFAGPVAYFFRVAMV